MTIQRRFEPDPEALEHVVEVLLRLLMEVPENRADRSKSGTAGAVPCVSTTAE